MTAQSHTADQPSKEQGLCQASESHQAQCPPGWNRVGLWLPSLITTELQEDQPLNLIWTISNPFPPQGTLPISSPQIPGWLGMQSKVHVHLTRNEPHYLCLTSNPVYLHFTPRASLFASLPNPKLNTSDACLIVFIFYIVASLLLMVEDPHIACSTFTFILSLNHSTIHSTNICCISWAPNMFQGLCWTLWLSQNTGLPAVVLNPGYTLWPHREVFKILIPSHSPNEWLGLGGGRGRTNTSMYFLLLGWFVVSFATYFLCIQHRQCHS